MTEEQIAHLEQHQAEFDAINNGEHRPIRDYAHEYAYIEDLYERVCDDLGIEPQS